MGFNDAIKLLPNNTLTGIGKNKAAVVTLPQKLEEPVFVKNLVYASDMDADVEFITNNNWGKVAEEVIIPNLPENMSLQFYGQDDEEWDKYSIHTLSFGVGADKLSKSSGLIEPFEFNEIIIKWDDGSETTANIGTIHMTAVEETNVLETVGGHSAMDADDTSVNEEEFLATKAVKVIDVYIPYADELKDDIYDITFDDKPINEITSDDPVNVAKNKTCILAYTIEGSNYIGYGKVALECQITTVDAEGREEVSLFYIHGPQGRTMPDWAEQQIINEETIWAK